MIMPPSKPLFPKIGIKKEKNILKNYEFLFQKCQYQRCINLCKGLLIALQWAHIITRNTISNKKCTLKICKHNVSIEMYIVGKDAQQLKLTKLLEIRKCSLGVCIVVEEEILDDLPSCSLSSSL